MLRILLETITQKQKSNFARCRNVGNIYFVEIITTHSKKTVITE